MFSEYLLEKNVHPTVITKGYRKASEKAQELLNKIAQKVTIKETSTLKHIAATAMTGKGAEAARDHLSALTVEAVKQIAETEDKIKIDIDNIKIEKKTGSGIEDSELVMGIILDKERVHSEMPNSIENPKIALIDSALEIKNTEIETKIQISDPTQMSAFLAMEEKMLKDMVEKITKSNANVVVCQKGIDDMVQHYLAKENIYAIRRSKKSDLEKLAKATGGKIISNLDDLTSKDLGTAAKIEEIKVGEEQMTYITGCKKAKAVTLLIRGGTEHVVDEVERAVKDALGDLSAALTEGKIVAGAGSIEIELARDVRKFANSLSGREQLAVQAFADSIEVIPSTLAENAGLDPIDTLTDMKAAHEKGDCWAGLDVFTGKIINAWKKGIIEPLKIKTQAIKSASEVTELILRIDDILASGKQAQQPMPQGGMPPMM